MPGVDTEVYWAVIFTDSIEMALASSRMQLVEDELRSTTELLLLFVLRGEVVPGGCVNQWATPFPTCICELFVSGVRLEVYLNIPKEPS